MQEATMPDTVGVGEECFRRDLRQPAGFTILVVDDCEAIRELAGYVLREKGYQVLEAGDGIAALEAAERHPGEVDLLITDWEMPRLGGAALIRRFAAAHPRASILIAATYPDCEPPAEAAILPKPFTLEDLLRKVGDLLQARS